MITLDDVKPLLGKYVDIYWNEADGSEGGMAGWLWLIDIEHAGVWLVVDYGYAIRLSAVTRIAEVDAPEGDKPLWGRDGETCKVCEGKRQNKFAPGPCVVCDGTGVSHYEGPAIRELAHAT